MKDVLYVPKLNANLLSIYVLTRKNFEVLFNKVGVKILKKNTLIVTEIAKKRTYFLRTIDTTFYITEGKEVLIFEKSVKIIFSRAIDASENSEKIPQTFNQKTNAFKLWHERLEHVSSIRVRLLTDQMIDMRAMKLHNQMTCDICDLIKLIKKINRKSSKRVVRRLERVHTDVWNFFRISSISRNRYFLFLIDDIIRKSWIFFLRTRNQIHQKIEGWRAEIRLKTGDEAAVFRSNNAKKYRKFANAVWSQSIKVEFTTAYTFEENEVAEKFNKIIIQMAKAMLL